MLARWQGQEESHAFQNLRDSNHIEEGGGGKLVNI